MRCQTLSYQKRKRVFERDSKGGSFIKKKNKRDSSKLNLRLKNFAGEQIFIGGLNIYVKQNIDIQIFENGPL